MKITIHIYHHSNEYDIKCKGNDYEYNDDNTSTDYDYDYDSGDNSGKMITFFSLSSTARWV